MTKLYLCKSENTFYESHDVIMNLDKVLTLRIIKEQEDNKFILQIDYNHEDAVSMLFSSEENAKKALSDILAAMGGDSGIANLIDIKSRSNRKAEFLKKLEQAINS